MKYLGFFWQIGNKKTSHHLISQRKLAVQWRREMDTHPFFTVFDKNSYCVVKVRAEVKNNAALPAVGAWH